MHEEVVIRHAASNQLQRNAPHCKPPAAPKRPPDRSQTAPAPACAYPALRLAITDEASPLALRSTRNRPRTAVRRGAARPRRSDQAAAGETLSRAGRRPHRRACMGCRAPQAPSTRTRLGVPARGRSEWWPRRSGCRPCLRHLSASSASVRCPVSGVRCERPVSTLACPRDRCPVRASERPGVRCPVSAVRRPVWASGVGVQCLCVAASAVSGRSEVLERGGGAGSCTAGMAGVGVVARCVHARLVVCLRRSLALEAGAVLGQPRRRFGPGRRRGRWLGSGQLDRVADQDRPGAREDRSLVGAGARRGSPPAAG
jgi:hypothetical protein